jgi:hypothetical protein
MDGAEHVLVVAELLGTTHIQRNKSLILTIKFVTSPTLHKTLVFSSRGPPFRAFELLFSESKALIASSLIILQPSVQVISSHSPL